tara:strand:- start:217 stop:852 length:636 start_codon:yes stop_codon:yes gene_type:complete
MEGTNVLVGSAAGTNQAININFYPCYLEGNSGNRMEIYPNAMETGIFGLFATGVSVIDNGERTQIFGGGTTKLFAGHEGANSFSIEAKNSGVRAPNITDLEGTAELELIDASGNTVSIINGTTTASSTRMFEVRDTNENNIIRCGINSSMLAGAELQLNNDPDLGILISIGSPEGVRAGKPGSICMNLSGGAGTSLYVKESGTGNTGWVAK